MLATVDRLFQQMSRDLPEVPFRVRMYDGSERRYGTGQEQFVLSINSADALSDVLTRGSLGFGEAYMDGGVEVEGDLQALIRFAFRPAVQELHLSARDKARLLAHVVKHRNNQRRSRENVHHHYDLGNDFYRLWLDESMTYSCAYWDEGCESLDQAQRAKYDHICRKLHLGPGDRLLDIGCGWGGMLAHAAAEYGVEGVGYTLSDQQFAYADRRLKDLGLYPRVRVELADYRSIEGEFDKFVSIGMFEHVGREFYGVFFEKVRELLVEGGIGVLHTIGREKESDTDPWVVKYIFPGGYLPTLAQIAQHMGENEFVIGDVENLRLHYARTLDAWAESFEAHEDEVRERLGDAFVRMWRFYLNSSSAGFKWGDTRVYQVAFTNGLRSDLPLTRAYLHA